MLMRFFDPFPFEEGGKHVDEIARKSWDSPSKIPSVFCCRVFFSLSGFFCS